LRFALVADEGIHAPSMTDRRIVLVGFMGCGKTTVGRELARRLNCELLDLDSFITERQGRSPAEIIQQDGEPAFRVIETSALDDVLRQSELRVIALGGGTWTVVENRALIAFDECVGVWLDAPFELCWKRITSGGIVRPLAPDRKTAQELYESRVESYALASIRVQFREGDSGKAIVDKILSLV
jgi:shikimate kinase